jgi:hypothetical protein
MVDLISKIKMSYSNDEILIKLSKLMKWQLLEIQRISALNWWNGSYYIKMSCSDDEILIKLSKPMKCSYKS